MPILTCAGIWFTWQAWKKRLWSTGGRIHYTAVVAAAAVYHMYLYCWNLIAGDKSIERPVAVRLDPSVKVSQADLESQLSSTLKLRDMQDATVDATRAMDSLKEQLDQIEKTAKARKPEMARELEKLLPGYRKQIDEASAKLGRLPDAPRLASPPGLLEEISILLSSIDGVNAAPTPAQRSWHDELSAKYRQRIDEANAFLKTKVTEFSEALRKLGAPGLM